MNAYYRKAYTDIDEDAVQTWQWGRQGKLRSSELVFSVQCGPSKVVRPRDLGHQQGMSCLDSLGGGMQEECLGWMGSSPPRTMG